MKIEFALGSRSTGLIIAVALQVAMLSTFVWNRVSILTSPIEIVLPVRPVDPRDLFRGDYVTLAYDISRASITPELRRTLDPDVPFWTVVQPNPDGGWTARVAGLRRPELAPGQTALRARAAHPGPFRKETADTVALRYGLESYFVPEGTGRELETLARDRKLSVVAAVSPGGEAAIKAIMVDGQIRWREPAF